MRWRKSSYSQGNGQCVEVGTDNGPTVAVRNSNRPEAGTLSLSAASVASFVQACADGELDDLTA